MSIFIFGHKNPDTDSVSSSIAFSNLKNKLGYETIPCVLGDINKESRFVLDYFEVDEPKFIKNVKIQVKDLKYDTVDGILPDKSILYAYKTMENNNLRTLPIVDENNRLLGIVTMKDIAMELIKGNFYTLNTSLLNIVDDLNGKILVGEDFVVYGKISVIAYYYETVKGTLGENDIIIVGDRYDIIEHCINSRVKLIILTGGSNLPEKYLYLAKSFNVPIISVPHDTYTTSKLINQCNYISSIMREDVIKFDENEYIEDITDDVITNNLRNYPIVKDNNIFLGFLGRKHLINPSKKKVILVDHNEYSQSADGLNEAEILEIVDHHKIGDIYTCVPINFRNMPVGSTCTIIYNMYKEQNIDIDYKTAGVLLAGIISDTLFFKSPTTTDLDKNAVDSLNKILNIDIEKFAMDMFKAGTSLEGFTIDEIFYKDFKEFNIEGVKCGIGQVFTLNIEAIFNRKEEFISFIEKVHEDKGYFLTLLVITDIIKEGSYLIYKCDNNSVIPLAFNISNQGDFSKGLVSRKKQVVPRIAESIKMIK
ncbi:manganese-dependent inorganic pyrophosphatase [Alkalithermobacter thermoalcaliphilus JW-YL-7 = DSM 7308]|uniref:inorganic diphosphatase n=1 Tax=Alkalithermobacter thermoalcaliphilus JW-YL-7 = DSM 7308 TaxID=1121328 RepID=A0A150FNI3_CLOPD|nr:putative signal transduction protein with CBS domain containing protein [[Clostridium] paradoxum JW-YL-7 = DSM 7308]SHK91930.1 manganese-dependent inorganic pyrophosphatase [[Clostridium] paradoxum JW-YL-7 = DSM 7308]